MINKLDIRYHICKTGTCALYCTYTEYEPVFKSHCVHTWLQVSNSYFFVDCYIFQKYFYCLFLVDKYKCAPQFTTVLVFCAMCKTFAVCHLDLNNMMWKYYKLFQVFADESNMNVITYCYMLKILKMTRFLYFFHLDVTL